MLPFSLDALDKAALERACAEKWSEGPRLDFKRDLPGRDNSAKNEFLKDVAAMANADGGDLVYGIEEAEGAASVLAPITAESSDDVSRRLGQMLDSSIEPRVSGIQIKAVPTEPGYCLVVRVPPSYDGPHRYSVDGKSRFVLRNNTHTPEMSYDQLRDAFGRRASLLNRAGEFIANRGINAAGNNCTYLNNPAALWVVHVVPLAGIAGRISIDIAKLDTDYLGFAFEERTSWTRTPNWNGLAIHESGEPNTAKHVVQVFRNGSVESVRVAATDYYAPHHVVPAIWIADHLNKVLTKYAAQAVKWGISGPGVLGLTLTNASGTALADAERSFTHTLLPEQNLAFEPVMLEEVSQVQAPYKLIRPLMDVIFQSYGISRCAFYDADGNWVGQRSH
jgi:hypothetical protein